MESTDVIKFLSKGGYLFENQCQNILRECGFDVNTGIFYQNSESDNFREIDLIATKSYFDRQFNFTFNVCLVIECKAHIQPLVSLSHNYGPDRHQVLKNLIASKNGKEMLDKLSISDKFCFGLESNEKCVQNIIAYADKGEKENRNQSKDRVYEAIMQVLSACHYLKGQSDISQKRFANIYIPVVMIDNLIYHADLSNTEQNVSKVHFIKLSKHYAFNERTHDFIHFVGNSDLKSYCEKMYAEIDNFIKDHEEEIRALSSSKPVNSHYGRYSII